MKNDHWQKLLANLTVISKLCTLSEADLDQFENDNGVQLPASYRSYCQTIGPGELAGWYCIAAPSYTGKNKRLYDLGSKTTANRTGRDWNEYSQDPKQFDRAILFADDSASAIFFWDPHEVSVDSESEYSIYVMFRDWTLQKLCATFADFVDICLHKKADVKLYDEQPPMIFRAADCGKGQKKRSSK